MGNLRTLVLGRQHSTTASNSIPALAVALLYGPQVRLPIVFCSQFASSSNLADGQTYGPRKYLASNFPAVVLTAHSVILNQKSQQ